MPSHPARKAIATTLPLLASLGLVFLFAGCKTTNSLTGAVITPSEKSPSKLSEPELREKLSAFYMEFVNSIDAATANAAANTQDFELRRRLLEGRIRAVRTCRQTVFQRQVMAAFVDTWNLCLQMEGFLKKSEGKERFAEAHPRLLKAVTQLREDIEAMGLLFLKPEELGEVKKRLEEFVEAHPYSIQHEIAFPSTDAGASIPQLGWLLSLPLSPFRAFEGVDKSVAAVHELTLVGASFAQSSRDMPRELSWETQVILLQMRSDMEALLTQVDQRQTNTFATVLQVHQAVTEARQAVADLNTSLVSGQGTAREITQAATALSALTETAGAAVKQFHDLYPPAPESATPAPAPDPPGRPFDILDYARTAEQIAVAATNLTRLLVEAQNTMGADGLSRRISDAQNTITQTQMSARSLADHVAMLAALLIIGFFVLLIVYRILAARLQKH